MWQKIKSQTNSNDSNRQLPEIKTGALFISFDHSLLFGHLILFRISKLDIRISFSAKKCRK
jgi:hypothetical protein